MDTRTPITAANLYLLLSREFTSRQSMRCAACTVSLPFRVDRHEAQAPNWEVAIPQDCGRDCGDLIQELAAEYQVRYELVLSTNGDE